MLSAYLVPSGAPKKIFDRIVKSKKTIKLVLSPHLRDEFERNLLKLNFSLKEVLIYSNFLLNLDRYVTPRTIDTVVSHKPDNWILATAAIGKADYLITGDKKHLLPLKVYKGVRIISPQEFINQELAKIKQ